MDDSALKERGDIGQSSGCSGLRAWKAREKDVIDIVNSGSSALDRMVRTSWMPYQYSKPAWNIGFPLDST